MSQLLHYILIFAIVGCSTPEESTEPHSKESENECIFPDKDSFFTSYQSVSQCGDCNLNFRRASKYCQEGCGDKTEPPVDIPRIDLIACLDVGVAPGDASALIYRDCPNGGYEAMDINTSFTGLIGGGWKSCFNPDVQCPCMNFQ